MNGDPNNESYQWYNENTWQDITPASIVSNEKEHILTFNFPVSLVNTETGLNMTASLNRRSATVECVINTPELSANISSAGAVWGTAASFQVACVTPTTRILSQNRVFMEYAVGSDWITPTQIVSGNNEITVTGLTPGTDYTFRARYSDSAAIQIGRASCRERVLRLV